MWQVEMQLVQTDGSNNLLFVRRREWRENSGLVGWLSWVSWGSSNGGAVECVDLYHCMPQRSAVQMQQHVHLTPTHRHTRHFTPLRHPLLTPAIPLLSTHSQQQQQHHTTALPLPSQLFIVHLSVSSATKQRATIDTQQSIFTPSLHRACRSSYKKPSNRT